MSDVFYLTSINFAEIVGKLNEFITFNQKNSFELTRISVIDQMSISYGGDTFDENYVLDVNGSVRIIDDCNIYGNLSVNGESRLNNLNVNGNMTNTGTMNIANANIKFFNVSSAIITNYLNIENDLNVSRNTSLNYMYAINSNLSNVSILNAKITNLTVSRETVDTLIVNNASIYRINSQFENIQNLSSINTSTYRLRVQDTSVLNTVTVLKNTSTLSLNVPTTTTLNTTFTNTLNSLNTSSRILRVMNNATLNTVTVQNNISANGIFNANNGLYVQSRNAFDNLYSAKFFGKIFAEEIICPTINATNPNIQPISIGLGAFSVYNSKIYYDSSVYSLIGFKDPTNLATDANNTIPIIFNCYGHGAFVYGLNADVYNLPASTFDLTANAGLTGITYNGPVNIGQTTPYPFNLSATNVHISGDVNLDNNLIIGGNITSTSDKRLKENLIPLSDCLNKINKINGYSYTRNDLQDTNKKYLGLIAQEVEEIFPELVTEKDNIKSINYQSFTAILLECIKELNNTIKNKIL
jgi:hypothetical protein